MVSAQELLAYMREEAYRPLAAADLAAALGLTGTEVRALERLLAGLEEEGRVVRTRTDRYGVPERMNLVVGRVQGHPEGYAFVIPDRLEEDDLFISPAHLNGAMHGDRVVARVHHRTRNGKRHEGEVIRILRRARSRVVGTMTRSRKAAFVVPDEKRLAHDIVIPREEMGDARSGDKVVVEITAWPGKRRNPEGRVVERLGPRGAPGVDILSIMRKYGLQEGFPAPVQRAAARVPARVRAEDIQGRRDLRDVPVVTIDGEDARDLDDAVSLEKLKDIWRLGVHIADVSHYVRPGSALDREARSRGTSVYLVDRVIPMLPPRLSNGICSLVPGEDRLTISVSMDFDATGRLLRHEIYPSVIRSREKMTYTAVANILEGEDGATRARYGSLVPMFEEMAGLCRILQGRRRERGSLEFNFPEEKVILDENGRPVEVRRVVRTIADQIIEEFMLACNETVAQHLHWLKVPLVYRVHEEPDEEKMLALDEFLRNFGLRLKGIRSIRPEALQAVLDRVRGRKEEYLVHTVTLRSLKQARYATESLGHFGLATRLYTHFTSPIRRYPDLVVHRILRGEVLEGGIPPARRQALEEVLPLVAEHCSERERMAEEAERETVRSKKVEFMADKLGQVYEGIVSGVVPYGLYVTLENTVEGLVHVSTMADDYYLYNEKMYALVGERSRKVYRVGDPVRVQVWRVNPEEQTIDFGLFSEGGEGMPGARRAAGKRKGRRQRKR